MIDLWESLFRMLTSLAIVLLLMGIAALVARRFLGKRMDLAGGRPIIQVLATGYVAPRKMISIVSVADEYLIVGTTATDLVPLGRISDSAHLHELLTATESQSGVGSTPGAQSILATWRRWSGAGSLQQDKESHVR